MSPDFRSLPLEFTGFWRIQVPQSPALPSGAEVSSTSSPRDLTFPEFSDVRNFRCHPLISTTNLLEIVGQKWVCFSLMTNCR